jgi:tRNA 2-selenouridine synthase
VDDTTIHCTFEGKGRKNIMVEKIEIEEFLSRSKHIPVIDVRSPGEYNQGHIPHAISLPLFDNEERATVGTIYKNSGRDAAILKGLELVGPKLTGFVKNMVQIAAQKEILIHCWRGGMRSEQMAWLFYLAGFKTGVLAGGYKSYRNFIRGSFSRDTDCIVIGGMTGSGKTDILHQISLLGEQILDLEMIACHKGSVFGGLGQEIQPTNEQFENDLYSFWQNFDFKKRIWIEDESRSIGTVIVPDPLFQKISHSPMIKIEIPKEARIQRLVNEYSGFKKGLLKEAVIRISEKLGGTRTSQALEAINENEFEFVAELVLTYYDKSYQHSVSGRINQNIQSCNFNEDNPAANALRILELIRRFDE